MARKTASLLMWLPVRPRFDPAKASLRGKPLRCAGGADTGNDCLSDAQISGVLSLERPLALDYKLASGETGYPGFTVWGTDFGAPHPSPLQPTVLTLALGTLAPASPMPPVKLPDSPPYGSTFYEQWVKYAVTRNAGYDALSLDPRAPGPWQQRIVALSALQEASRSDYSAFKARGGKILMAHGMHDALVSPRATRQLMQRLRTTMGEAELASMLRYYEIPAVRPRRQLHLQCRLGLAHHARKLGRTRHRPTAPGGS